MSKARTSRSNSAGRKVNHDRLPALVADLIRRPVAVIVGNSLAALAAKAATTTVPIVFASRERPGQDGLVASLNRPGGNVTGVSFIVRRVGAETTGAAAPARAQSDDNCHARRTRTVRKPRRSGADVQAAALAIGQQLVILDASSDHDIETAFATFVQRGAGALLVGTGRVLELPSGTDRRAGGTPCAAGDLCPARVRRGRWPDELWNQHNRCLSPGRHLRRADSQRREAGRPAGHAVHQIRASASTSRPPRRSGSTVPPTLLALADEVIE